MKKIVKKDIIGIAISDTRESEVLEYIFSSLGEIMSSYYIVTPNPEIIVASTGDTELQALLNAAEISLCDGTGLFAAAKILGKPLKERITGTDLMEKICKESVRKPVSIGFLGGKQGVAVKTAECLQRKYGNFKVGFVGDEWHTTPSAKRQAPSVDILFVAFGFPKQERWMAEYKEKGVYKVAIGVGGAFDYLSGNVSRAPEIIRAIGFEWLYRLIRQPWRWRRQLALIQFVWLVIKKLAPHNT